MPSTRRAATNAAQRSTPPPASALGACTPDQPAGNASPSRHPHRRPRLVVPPPPRPPPPACASAPLRLPVGRVATLWAAGGPCRHGPARLAPQAPAAASGGTRRAASRRARMRDTRRRHGGRPPPPRGHVTRGRCRHAAAAAAAWLAPCARRQSIRPTADRRCGWKMRSAFLVGSGANPIHRECTVQYSTVHYGGVGPQQGSNRASLAPPPLTGGLWLAVATIQCYPRPHPSGGPVGRPLAHATPFKYPCCGWRAFSQRDEYPSGPCPLAWSAGDPTHAPGGASTDSVVGGAAAVRHWLDSARRAHAVIRRRPSASSRGWHHAGRLRGAVQSSTNIRHTRRRVAPPHVTGWRRTGAPPPEAATAGRGPAPGRGLNEYSTEANRIAGAAPAPVPRCAIEGIAPPGTSTDGRGTPVPYSRRLPVGAGRAPHS